MFVFFFADAGFAAGMEGGIAVFLQDDAAFVDFLQAVVFEGDVIVEVEAGAGIAFGEFGGEEPGVGVVFFEFGVAEGHDLRQEGVESHEDGESVFEVLLFFFLQAPEAFDGGINGAVEQAVVAGGDFLGFEEDFGEFLYVARPDDAGAVELALEVVEAVGIGGSAEGGPFVEGLEGVEDFFFWARLWGWRETKRAMARAAFFLLMLGSSAMALERRK